MADHHLAYGAPEQGGRSNHRRIGWNISLVAARVRVGPAEGDDRHSVIAIVAYAVRPAPSQMQQAKLNRSHAIHPSMRAALVSAEADTSRRINPASDRCCRDPSCTTVALPLAPATMSRCRDRGGVARQPSGSLSILAPSRADRYIRQRLVHDLRIGLHDVAARSGWCPRDSNCRSHEPPPGSRLNARNYWFSAVSICSSRCRRALASAAEIARLSKAQLPLSDPWNDVARSLPTAASLTARAGMLNAVRTTRAAAAAKLWGAVSGNMAGTTHFRVPVLKTIVTSGESPSRRQHWRCDICHVCSPVCCWQVSEIFGRASAAVAEAERVIADAGKCGMVLGRTS